jgi:hypothetical protein
MSIAVSAVIAPSRLLRLALCTLAAACLAAALWLAARPNGFHGGAALALVCLAGAVAAGRRACRCTTTRRIDISGPGEIRLLVQHSMGAAPVGGARAAPPWQLAPGSTLWPGLLIVRLRRGPGAPVTVVTILPDSVPAEHFRKIAVALRAIAGRDNQLSEKHKIL